MWITSIDDPGLDAIWPLSGELSYCLPLLRRVAGAYGAPCSAAIFSSGRVTSIAPDLIRPRYHNAILAPIAPEFMDLKIEDWEEMTSIPTLFSCFDAPEELPCFYAEPAPKFLLTTWDAYLEGLTGSHRRKLLYEMRGAEKRCCVTYGRPDRKDWTSLTSEHIHTMREKYWSDPAFDGRKEKLAALWKEYTDFLYDWPEKQCIWTCFSSDAGVEGVNFSTTWERKLRDVVFARRGSFSGFGRAAVGFCVREACRTGQEVYDLSGSFEQCEYKRGLCPAQTLNTYSFASCLGEPLEKLLPPYYLNGVLVGGKD